MTLDKDGMSAPKAKLKCLLHYVSNKTVFGPEYGNTHLLRYTKIFDKGGKTIISAKVAISTFTQILSIFSFHNLWKQKVK